MKLNDRFSVERDTWCWNLNEIVIGKDKDGNPKETIRTTYHATLSQAELFPAGFWICLHRFSFAFNAATCERPLIFSSVVNFFSSKVPGSRYIASFSRLGGLQRFTNSGSDGGKCSPMSMVFCKPA